MKKLDLYSVDEINQLAWPESTEMVTVASSALEVFTDFREIQPMVIAEDTLALDAEKFMLQSHVRLKIVVDEQHNFLGLISLDDLNSQEIIKRVSNGSDRNELSVKDFMRPKGQLQAFDFSVLEKTTIMDVINALKTTGQQHCLVVDFDGCEIRGIISASDISRKLKIPLNITQNSNFISIFNALYH